MVRKWAGRAVLLYILFVAVMYWYIFYGADTSIPQALRGTAADPATFLNARELKLSEEYSGLRNFLFFVSTPYEWLLYFFVLLFGFSKAFEKSALGTSKWKVIQTGIYLFWLSLVSYLALFPISFIGYRMSKSYHISTQSFSSWMKDEVIDFWVNFGITFIIVSVLYWLMKKSVKKWWLYAWLLSIPFSLFLMFLQPVLIDPLYNEFYPLKNKELETEILALAAQAEIPAEHVYEVNMAEKTNALNAYVTGIGSNSRIVLWDTILNKLEEDEILFIMAHEMAHYVEKHIYIGIAGYLGMTLVGLWLTSKIMNYFIRRWGHMLKIHSIDSISSLPLFLLITGVLLFASSPLSNYVSRYQETRADRYAIEMTGDKESAITTFQELTRAGLSQVNPPLLVKWLRYSHPTMLERISTVENDDTTDY
ncbi:M48 family metallopeptidase [Peribacillus butanolivorans]|uniref:M48 family metallopeptidase n=1 Tax=Peribacillus butanolivorans TaxID=421767 RepID=UPI00207C219D|nr:M48 family metallopeptidase [Peribacillus butanolivorans]MCO0598230.1 M48 family metallopeptidase [Peribacillus butanolivorans]